MSKQGDLLEGYSSIIRVTDNGGLDRGKDSVDKEKC